MGSLGRKAKDVVFMSLKDMDTVLRRGWTGRNVVKDRCSRWRDEDVSKIVERERGWRNFTRKLRAVS